jgi:hypothetical protein
MSDYGNQSQSQEIYEQTTSVENSNEREPGEIREDNRQTSNSANPSQQSSTQLTVPDVNPAVFIGHAARRLRLETFVSDYCDGKRTKDETLTAICNELDKGPAISAEEKASALRLCIEEIDSAETRTDRGLAAERQANPQGGDTVGDRNLSDVTSA